MEVETNEAEVQYNPEQTEQETQMHIAELFDQATQSDDQPVALIPVPMPVAFVLAPIHLARGIQTDLLAGVDILTQTDSKKYYEISIQTDVVPELVKLRLLNDITSPDLSDPTKSFLGVMQKGQKRRRM